MLETLNQPQCRPSPVKRRKVLGKRINRRQRAKGLPRVGRTNQERRSELRSDSDQKLDWADRCFSQLFFFLLLAVKVLFFQRRSRAERPAVNMHNPQLDRTRSPGLQHMPTFWDQFKVYLSALPLSLIFTIKSSSQHLPQIFTLWILLELQKVEFSYKRSIKSSQPGRAYGEGRVGRDTMTWQRNTFLVVLIAQWNEPRARRHELKKWWGFARLLLSLRWATVSTFHLRSQSITKSFSNKKADVCCFRHWGRNTQVFQMCRRKRRACKQLN